MNSKPLPVVLSALLAGLLPVAANAQSPSYATAAETIRGTISSVESINHIFVADDRGFTDDVTLRPGTQIMSNGVRLEPGQRVTVTGSNGGSTFLATRIATSGRSDADASSAAVAYAVPVPAYYPAPVYYPAPYYYGAPYYGSFGVSLFFGSRYGYGYRGGYYGGYHGGYYGGYHGGYYGGYRGPLASSFHGGGYHGGRR